MRLVVDANIVVAAVLQDSSTRELLLHAPLELYAPEWFWDELARNLPELARRSGVPVAVLSSFTNRLLQRIQPVAQAMIAVHAGEARRRCKRSGSKDAPYVACCLAVDAALWSHDRMLAKEAGVDLVTTGDVLGRM